MFTTVETPIVRSLMTRALVLALLVLSARTATAATPIRIGVPESGNIQYISLWVALGAAYFEAEGLDVELVIAPAPNQVGQLLVRREADVVLVQPPMYLGLIAQRAPIVLFANLLANDPINLVVRPEVAARLNLDPHAPLVDRLKALKGLRIGVANEPPRRLRILFGQAGMDADRDIRMQVIPGEEQVAAYRDAVVDGLYTHTPYLEDVLSQGAVLVVNQSAGEVAPLSDGQIHSLAATREYANGNPDVLVAVTRAIARAQELLRHDADAAARAVTKAGVRTPTPKQLSTIVELYRHAVPATPRVSAAAIEQNVRLYPARPAAPDFKELHAADFIAPEIAGQALAQLQQERQEPVEPFYLGSIAVNVTARPANLSPVTDVLDGVAIRDRQALTVSQAIEYLPGVSVDHKAPRNQAGISIGGFDSRQVPLYLDGTPAYLPFDGYVDLNRYLTSDVGEVQVAKGYSSPLLGPNALGGAINIVTRQPRRALEGDVLVGMAPGNQLNTGIHVGSRSRAFFLQASADRLESDFFPLSQAFVRTSVQPGVRRVNADQQDTRYRLRVGWTPRGQDQYVFSYSNQDGTTGVPPYSGVMPACPSGNAALTTPCVTPKFWRWPFWNADSYYFNSTTAIGSRTALRLRAFYSTYANRQDMYDDGTYSSMNLNTSSGMAHNADQSAGVSGDVETRAIGRHTLAASFFVKHDTHTERTTTFSKTNIATTTPRQEDLDRQSSFGIRDVVEITSSLRATVGLSADLLDGLQAQDLGSDRTQVVPFQVPGVCASNGAFSSCTAYAWTFNPVTAITYTTPRAGSLFVTYGHKSRFPTIKDRYSYKAGRAIPNPALDPERARTWTAGYTHLMASRTVAQLDVFRSDVRDEIENIFFLSPLCSGGAKGGPGSCQQAVNVGSEMHAGVNVAVRSSAIPRVTVDANYSFLHRRITDGSGALPTGTPTHKAVATATGLLPHGITALLSLRHQSGTIAMSDNGLPLPRATATTMDVGGSASLRYGMSVQAGVKNLLDADYYFWEGFPEAGRNAYLTLRYTF